MAPYKYIIVGAEVDQAIRYIKPGGTPDGTITATAGPGHVPLNVEYIGALMVKLSQLGKAKVPAADLAKYEAQVKNALRVRPIGGQDIELTAEEEQKILDNTTVSIVFETRSAPQAPATTDLNRRILVVPSDDTLKLKEAELMADEGSDGFEPPLSYPLDRTLMLASLTKTITGIFDSFPLLPSLPEEMKTEFTKHVDEKIKGLTTVLDSSENPADSVLNHILTSPVRAFHRSVGIYATNMCR